MFAQQWKNRGVVTSTGISINHKDLILALSDAIQLPAKVAICKCAAHTKNTDPVSKGNTKAEKGAKKAAQLPAENLLSEQETHIEINHHVLCDMQKAAPQRQRQMCACIFLSHYSNGTPENWECWPYVNALQCISNGTKTALFGGLITHHEDIIRSLNGAGKTNQCEGCF